MSDTVEQKEPLGEAPFSSWTWNGHVWEAPVAFPGDGTTLWAWNEDSQEWDLIEVDTSARTPHSDPRGNW
jgi:hypothetical protein